MNKQEIETYVRGLCKDKGYDDAKTERAVAKALERADDEDEVLLQGVLELPIKGTADYNKKVDELKTKATTLDNWHKTAQATVTASEQKARDAEAKAAKYREQFGEIDDEDNAPSPDPSKPAPRKPAKKVVDETTLQGILAARDEYHLRLAADLGDIRARHAKMFKGEIISDREILAEIGKVANDPAIPEAQRNITAQQAYERLYGEKVAQFTEAETKAAEQRLRDEGAKAERERMSRQGLRSGAVVGESAVIDAINRKKDDPRDKLTEEDRIAALASDMETEFAKQEARYSGADAGA